MYNRPIRVHKILYKALQHMQIQQFLQQSDESLSDIYRDQLNDLLSFYTHAGGSSLTERTFTQGFVDYVSSQPECNPTFSYWDSYLDLMQILLSFIRATRESNWEGHLNALRQCWMPDRDAPTSPGSVPQNTAPMTHHDTAES